MDLCLSVSVTSRCSIETDERIELGFFGMGASFDVSYTVLEGNSCTSKIRVYRVTRCPVASIRSPDAFPPATLNWRRGVVVSGVRRMNEVNARRARLVPGRVTVFGRVYHLGM